MKCYNCGKILYKSYEKTSYGRVMVSSYYFEGRNEAMYDWDSSNSFSIDRTYCKECLINFQNKVKKFLKDV